MTGLYVHIPFCKKKCHYCDFVIAPAGGEGRHAAFLNAFEREAAHHAPRFSGVAFETVYLGGGTPSVLRPAEFRRLFDILKKNFRWKPGAEVTCEANPGDADADKAALWKSLGVNRVSLGAQSFHEATLKKLNRAHGAADIERSFKSLRKAGFSSINMDLILSLPGESWGLVHGSLEKAVSLGPEHFSLYELTVEEKTVFGRMAREGKLNAPEEDEQLEILSKAREYLKKAGYRHYELLNYSKPGFESRHNLLYWANADYLGLGPGAYSYFDGRRFKYAESHEQYLAKVSKGDWRAAEEEALDGKEKDIESFLLALRLAEGADAKRFERVLEGFKKEIADLGENGLVIREKGRIRLSTKGQFFAETVFSELSK